MMIPAQHLLTDQSLSHEKPGRPEPFGPSRLDSFQILIRKKSVWQQHGIDYVNHAIRLIDICRGDGRRAAFVISEDDVTTIHHCRESASTHGFQPGLHVTFFYL